MRVLLVDDHPMLCNELSRHIQAIPFKVPIEVSSTNNLDDAIAIVNHPSPPNLVFLDLGLDQTNRGSATLRRFQQNNPHSVPVVIFTGLDIDEEGAVDTLRECLFEKAIKARGVILKRAKLEEMVVGLTRLINGETWMPQRVIEELATRANETAPRGYHLGLSPREWDVALRMARGLQDREIAREIQRSPEYVRQVAGQIFRKLNAKNRTVVAGVMHQQGYA